MIKRARYNIGGYEGNQLGPIVQAILNDADAAPNGRIAPRELFEALHKHVTVWGTSEAGRADRPPAEPPPGQPKNGPGLPSGRK